MNFFKHHIGDYASATDHLTWDEDMVYTRLLRVYYRDEKPLPREQSKIKRLIRCTGTRRDRAIQSVLTEFFQLQEDGYHNKRADAEIAQAEAQRQANRRVATERWGSNRERTENDSYSNRVRQTESAEKSRTPLQTPDSNSQTPLAKEEIKTGGGGDRAARSAAPTQLGIEFELTPDRRAYAEALGLDAKRTFELFVNHFVAADGPKSFSRNWDARWRKWCLEDSNKPGTPRKAAPGEAPSWLTAEEREEFNLARETARAN